MAERRELALVLVGTVADIDTRRTQTADFIQYAHLKLAVRVRVLRKLLAGDLHGEVFDFDDIICPLPVLERARDALAHEAALHAKAVRVVALYARAHPALHDMPGWQGCLDDRLFATQRADGALRHLRLAMSHTEATLDAVRVANASFLTQSAAWTAWITEAVELARLATFNAGMALQEAKHMRRALLSEVFTTLRMVMLGLRG
ncbi:hypothetical protein ACP70R_031126 [Stipagrostis hirtigluma subsp. patula]